MLQMNLWLLSLCRKNEALPDGARFEACIVLPNLRPLGRRKAHLNQVLHQVVRSFTFSGTLRLYDVQIPISYSWLLLSVVGDLAIVGDLAGAGDLDCLVLLVVYII